MTNGRPHVEEEHRYIAVGTDFTQGSKVALERATQLARDTSSGLLLVHIVPESSVIPVGPLPGDWATHVMPAATPEGREALKAAAELAEERITLDAAGVDAQAIVRAGSPHEGLAEAATSRGAWLLVVGVRASLVPNETFFLGTTAERTLRHGATPMLLARESPQRVYHRVLLPLEPGDLSLRVLRTVARMLPNAEYDVVHFIPPRGPKEDRGAMHRDTVVAELTGLCEGAGMNPKQIRVRAFVAEPRDGILGEIRTRAPDLIALGTHARSGVARVLLGSVADYVIHAAAGVDVLVVPPQPPAK